MLIRKKYSFTSKSDSDKEPLGIIEANSLNEAVKFFSQMKDLPIDSFMSLYNIEEHARRNITGAKQMLFG